MEKTTTIYEKLLIIQSRLKAPKNQFNEFGNYKYRNCEDILEAVKPLLLETQTVLLINDKVELIGDRYYLKSTARLYDTQSQGCIENHAYAREALEKKKMDSAQVTGSTSSYARKYALNGLFAIDDTKDSDYTNKGDLGANKTTTKETKQYRQEIAQILATKKISFDTFVIWLQQNLKVDNLDGLTDAQLEKIKKTIATW